MEQNTLLDTFQPLKGDNLFKQTIYLNRCENDLKLYIFHCTCNILISYMMRISPTPQNQSYVHFKSKTNHPYLILYLEKFFENPLDDCKYSCFDYSASTVGIQVLCQPINKHMAVIEQYVVCVCSSVSSGPTLHVP